MRPGDKGLTLVEMLVALSVFSVIATSCLVMLRLGINSNEQLSRTSAMMTEFQVARSLFKQDMAQVTSRPVRNEIGTTVEAPMFGGAFIRDSFAANDNNETLLIAMITNGRANPEDIYPQSSLQYIEYRLIEENIVRRVWAYPDRQEGTPHSEQILFNGVSDVRIRFLDGLRWTDQWQSRAGAMTPRVVEIEFVHPKLGPITQLFYSAGIAA